MEGLDKEINEVKVSHREFLEKENQVSSHEKKGRGKVLYCRIFLFFLRGYCRNFSLI